MTYVGLLRGINVGGRIIKMAELQAAFKAMGFTEINTVLQSGNVIFASGESDPAKLKRTIEDGLTKTFNYPAKVWTASTDGLEKIIAANPYSDAPADYHQYVIFFENDLAKYFAAEAVELDNEAIRLGPSVVYWKVRKGQTLKSPRGKTLGKAKYRASTTRNMNTLRKLYQLMLAAES